MTMTTRGNVRSVETRDAIDNGPKGGAVVETESAGKPSEDMSPATQSPATLQGNVVAAALQPGDSAGYAAQTQSPSGLKAQVVGSFSGAEMHPSTTK